MKIAAYSASIADETTAGMIDETIATGEFIEAVSGSPFEQHLCTPAARDLDLNSDRYDASESTVRIMSDACMVVFESGKVAAYCKKR